MDFPQKYFTPEEANAMLPLVSAIVNDLKSFGEEYAERRERLTALFADDASMPAAYREELLQAAKQLQEDQTRLLAYVQELQELGLECKGVLEGLVDFPAWKVDRPVYLCWKLGEATVAHWHEISGGFAGRQLLNDDDEFASAPTERITA